MKGLLRLLGAHGVAMLCVGLALGAKAGPAHYDSFVRIADRDAPEISEFTESTSRRRKRTRYRSLLAPHERPERPRLA